MTQSRGGRSGEKAHPLRAAMDQAVQPASLNTCPSLTAIGVDSRGCATPGKTPAITRRKRERPSRVREQVKNRELIENFQAIDRLRLQGKTSIGLRALWNDRFAGPDGPQSGGLDRRVMAGLRRSSDRPLNHKTPICCLDTSKALSGNSITEIGYPLLLHVFADGLGVAVLGKFHLFDL